MRNPYERSWARTRGLWMEEETNYQLSTSVNEGIVEFVLTGKLTQNGVEKLTNEALGIAKTLNARYLLVDVRALEGRFGPAEALHRIRSYPPDRPTLHTAVVDIPENAEYGSFHEALTRSFGLSLRWFASVDAARAWLKSMQGGGSGSAHQNKAE